MDQIFRKFSYLKDQFVDQIFKNPYDTNRNFVVQLLRENIPYFQHLSDTALKRIYYHALKKTYTYETNLFEIGDKC